MNGIAVCDKQQQYSGKFFPEYCCSNILLQQYFGKNIMLRAINKIEEDFIEVVLGGKRGKLKREEKGKRILFLNKCNLSNFEKIT